MTLRIDAGSSTAILSGAWSPHDLERFAGASVKRLIARATPDIEFLRVIPAIQELELTHLPLKDIRPLESQRQLRAISLNAYYDTPIDFGGFPELDTLHLDWGPGAESVARATHLVELSMNRYPGVDLAPLSGLTRLRSLRIAGARRLASLEGIEALGLLERARLLDLRALSDIEAIGRLAASLRSLELNRCRRIGHLDALGALTRLERLAVLDCGSIASLRPLRGLPLRELYFYDSTNILDGDLSVLLDIRSLRDTSFADRRGYSHRRDDIMRALSARAEAQPGQ